MSAPLVTRHTRAPPKPPRRPTPLTLHSLPAHPLLQILAHLSASEIAHLQTALPSPPFLHVTRDALLWRSLLTRDYPAASPRPTVGPRGTLDWQRAYEEARRRDGVLRAARRRRWGFPGAVPSSSARGGEAEGGRGAEEGGRCGFRVRRTGNVHRIVAVDRGGPPVVVDGRANVARFDWTRRVADREECG